MNLVRETFGVSKALLAVIHIQDERQMLQNIDVAREARADGVFLIDHDPRRGTDNLLQMYASARTRHPDYWIGLNLLRVTSLYAVQHVPPDADGLWTDNVDEMREQFFPEVHAERVWRHLEERRSAGKAKCLYFGGFAFKGQRRIHDLPRMTKLFAPFTDVITTSGDATGIAPSPEKLRTIKESTEGFSKPIANASGTTIRNVESLAPYCDCFLVASGINKPGDFYNLDRLGTATLAALLHNYP